MKSDKAQHLLEKAILYRATYRGSKEADVIVGGFAREMLTTLSDLEKQDFARLLTFDDIVIFSWLDGLPFESVSISDSLRDKMLAFKDECCQRKAAS